MAKKQLVYAVYSRAQKAVKIGRTTQDIRKRMEALQTGNPDRLYLLFTEDGHSDAERYWHRRFEKYRIRPDGEWFRYTATFKTVIQEKCPFKIDNNEEEQQ